MVEGDKLREWKRANRYQLSIDLNRNSESDKPIIAKLESVDNKSGYVKGLIRRDIGESGK